MPYHKERVKSEEKIFFPNLDGLRYVAFLLVFFQHGIQHAIELLNIKSPFLYRLIELIFNNGGGGVSIFFVLSGFLITYIILAEIKLNNKFNIGYFYIRRSLRIWPLYFAICLFVFILYPFVKDKFGIETHLAHRPLYYFSFLSNFDVINIAKYFHGMDSMSGAITWSVAIEEQFYLVWPLLFLLIPKRFYIYIFPTVIAGSLAFRYVNRLDGYVLYFHTLGVCADLAIGGLCAYMILNYKSFLNLFEKLSKPTIITIYLTGIIWSFYSIKQTTNEFLPVYSRLISTIFYAFIILEQNFCEHSFYKFSQFKFMSDWGKYTYGLYLLHPVAITVVDILLRLVSITYRNTFPVSFIAFIASLILSSILSYFSYEYFEKKFLSLKEKFAFIHK